jgi:hypothetical protein
MSLGMARAFIPLGKNWRTVILPRFTQPKRELASQCCVQYAKVKFRTVAAAHHIARICLRTGRTHA